ncbi:protein Spindly-like [Lutzomyia longipalpis]|uniref:protein Spindly-like n=1 Tax=Lutzomyia longipalpis TaxID=7200 RepID=UPI002483D4AF|nr:protein Spindly-like [Lutzomyia longipalpis]
MSHSSRSTVLISSLQSLSHDELQEEYRKLEKTCQELQKQMENGKQQIYELQRNLSTSTATQNYLSAEVESLQSSRDAEIEEVRKKFLVEIEKLKEDNGRLCGDRSNLERQLEEMAKCMEEQQRSFELKLAEKDSEKCLNVSKNDTLGLDFEAKITELSEKIQKLERDALELANSRRDLVQERDELREKVEILESRSQGHVEEIEEKSQLIEELQAKLFEVNTEMMALKNDPNAMNRKGNSLFAEVDDQRQKMKAILSAQSKKYNEMKAAYLEGQVEIKRLKKENSDIAEEFNYIKKMFVNADVAFKKELLEQIGQQKKEIMSVREKLMWTEEKLNETAKTHGVTWTNEMMKYCNTQVAKLEINLKTVLHQKIQLGEENHRKQQDLAKWRYKCLKYRCALMNRELLLEECGVKFPDIHEIPVNPNIQVDINNFDDTFEHQREPPEMLAKKPPAFPIHDDDSLPQIPEESKENIPSTTANKITYRDINFPPPKMIEKPKNSPVAVYLVSNAETTSTDNLPGGERKSPAKLPAAPKRRDAPKSTHFTIKKIVFRK